jgi:molybdenum cofactor cytidylyltransferase
MISGSRSASACSTPAVAAIILAAGRGARMGTPCKALMQVGGRPMILGAVEAALQSRAAETWVVVGHAAENVRETLAPHPVRIVDNPEYRRGLSTSLRAGLTALEPHIEAAVILLADMPLIRSHHIDRLIGAFAEGGAAICLPVHAGRPGNPVLWGRRLFPALARIEGDRGGRALLAEHAAHIRQVEMDDAILVDVDEPADLRRVECPGRESR